MKKMCPLQWAVPLAAALVCPHALADELKPSHTLAGHSGYVLGVALTRDGVVAVTGSADDTLRVWNIAERKSLRVLRGHDADVNAVALSPDDRLIASGGDDGMVRLWELDSGKPLQTLSGHGQPVLAVAFSKDGKWLASAGSDNTLRIWDIPGGRPSKTIDIAGMKINSLFMEADTLYSHAEAAGNKGWRRWNLSTGQSELLNDEPDAIRLRRIRALTNDFPELAWKELQLVGRTCKALPRVTAVAGEGKALVAGDCERLAVWTGADSVLTRKTELAAEIRRAQETAWQQTQAQRREQARKEEERKFVSKRDYEALLTSADAQAVYLAAALGELDGQVDKAIELHRALIRRFPNHELASKSTDALIRIDQAPKLKHLQILSDQITNIENRLSQGVHVW